MSEEVVNEIVKLAADANQKVTTILHCVYAILAVMGLTLVALYFVWRYLRAMLLRVEKTMTRTEALLGLTEKHGKITDHQRNCAAKAVKDAVVIGAETAVATFAQLDSVRANPVR